ncbi:MAG: CPBP family intramembrane glutamic endopeptidase [Myxococcota bacterium]
MTVRRIRLAVVVYGLLSLAAVLWGTIADRLDLYHHPEPWVRWEFPHGTLLAILLGVGVALLVVAATRVLVRRTAWARRMHVEFRSLLGPLDSIQILVFALASGVAEELFFRGAMQPDVGLVVASLAFGLVHILPRMWPWTLWALVMGFVFGVLYALTGELIAPVVAHVLINYENLHFIEAYDPSPPSGAGDRSRRREPSEPDLVSGRLRTGGRVR